MDLHVPLSDGAGEETCDVSERNMATRRPLLAVTDAAPDAINYAIGPGQAGKGNIFTKLDISEGRLGGLLDKYY